MEHLYIPKDYQSQLSLYDTQVAIKTVKDFFQQSLAEQLYLLRVSAPLFVTPESGLNDNLNGVERPVTFGIKEQNERPVEIVHSLAKWKRNALKQYGFHIGEGLYTDMSAIRRDEDTDNIHSIYVDQWDWEKIILKEDRNKDYLKETVRKVYKALKKTEKYMSIRYDYIEEILPRDIFFITTQELADRYPDNTPKERENLIAKEKGAVFLMEIGDKLADGKPHDGRAPDYDDWSSPDARSGRNYPSRKQSWSRSFPIRWAAESASPESVCSICARPISGRFRFPSGRRMSARQPGCTE